MKSLDKYKEGDIIQLSMTHPSTLSSLQTHIAQGPRWWKESLSLSENFDSDKMKPLYYCTRCDWVEDGGHRLAALLLRGESTVPVEIHHDCISPNNWAHSHRAGWQIPWPLTPEDLGPDPYHRVLHTVKTMTPDRDHDLINHSYYKWTQMNGVVGFKRRTVLDIGCHSGIITNLAAFSGAALAVGLEERDDILTVARRLTCKYGFDNVIFGNGFFGKDTHLTPNSFDIVLCLGVLHKFYWSDYPSRIAELCNAAKHTLVIEMMTYDDDEPPYDEKPGGGRWPVTTHVSADSLTKMLKDNGFTVSARKRSTLYPARALWVARRKA